MVRFTHLINPFVALAGSEHDRAQRITFASMAAAANEAAKSGIEVEVLAAVYERDLPAVQGPARPLPLLHRSVQDIKKLKPARAFPLIQDLLQIAYEEGRGDYLVYTNIDIALQPHFYTAVEGFIQRTSPREFAGTITRRTIADTFTAETPLAEMYRAPSHPHPGHDCFIFPRHYVPRFQFNEICIGARYFDLLLAANMNAISGFGFQRLAFEELTFHLGDDRAWVSRIDYEEFNLYRTAAAMKDIEKRYGSAPPGSITDYANSVIRRDLSLQQRALRQIKRLKPLLKLKHKLENAKRNRSLQKSKATSP